MRHLERATLPVALACVVIAAPSRATTQQSPDPYATRPSQCHHTPPPGRPLVVRRTDSGIRTSGYTAERLVTLSADAGHLAGGEIVVCTEYGSVEIIDSDDDIVRLQVRMEGFGEGSDDTPRAARQVIDETALHTHLNEREGKLFVRVWHSTLGFTQPGRQPTWLSVRLQLPNRGAYHVRTEAFHGIVGVRRLTLAGATMRGNVGIKLKGIPGFVGGTELEDVTLAGGVDIDNLIGIPGVRAPVPAALVHTAAPILVKARVATSGRLRAVTGGTIDIGIQPAPDLGVEALGQSNRGQVRVGLDAGSPLPIEPDSSSAVQQRFVTAGYAEKAKRLQVIARSLPGNVNVASVPAAPLFRAP